MPSSGYSRARAVVDVTGEEAATAIDDAAQQQHSQRKSRARLLFILANTTGAVVAALTPVAALSIDDATPPAPAPSPPPQPCVTKKGRSRVMQGTGYYSVVTRSTRVAGSGVRYTQEKLVQSRERAVSTCVGSKESPTAREQQQQQARR